MTTKNKRKTYSAEFKEEALKLASKVVLHKRLESLVWLSLNFITGVHLHLKKPPPISRRIKNSTI
ncbi:hypothetical protein [Paraglaciecola arctica]|uniref:hypothetical protein n=1 Tax=Paraglaciecola arctica TaxID=1128911 RepID=UPI000587331A